MKRNEAFFLVVEGIRSSVSGMSIAACDSTADADTLAVVTVAGWA